MRTPRRSLDLRKIRQSHCYAAQEVSNFLGVTTGMLPIRIVVYETTEPLRPDERFLAFVTDGSSVLPVRFMSASADGAREAAIAFWITETAKNAAKKANTKVRVAAAAAKRRERP